MKIASYVSTQVYQLQDNSLIAYIFNHKTNEFIELEGFSAVLWQFIMNGYSYHEIVSFSKENFFNEELNNFLRELYSIGLILITDKNIEFISIKKNNSELNINNDIYSGNSFDMERIRDFLIKNGFLPNLFLETTYSCNLKCIHCFNEKYCKKQMKFEDIKPAIDEAIELGVLYITLSGGECTLNKDFIKIIEYIRKKKIAFSFFTNGQTLYDNEYLFNKIISLYPYSIALSLYSMNSEIHDKITGTAGSHYKTLSVIKKLKENNINVQIKCFLTKYNAYEYELIQNYAKNNNISLTLDYKLLPNPCKSNKDIEITKKQLLDLFTNKNSILYIKKTGIQNMKKLCKKERICNGGYVSLLINPNLDIYVCPSLKIPLGNYKNISLKNVWKVKNSKLNKIKSLKKSVLKQCYSHNYCKYCTYCLGIAHSYGYYLQPCPNFCKEAKIKIKAAEMCGIYDDIHK